MDTKDTYLISLLPLDTPRKWRKPRLVWGVDDPTDKSVTWEFNGYLRMNLEKSMRTQGLNNTRYPYEYESAAYFEKWLQLYYDRPLEIVGVYLEKRNYRGQSYIDFIFGFRFLVQK